jgi:tetratricopeptide (TPR) repeat protein
MASYVLSLKRRLLRTSRTCRVARKRDKETNFDAILPAPSPRCTFPYPLDDGLDEDLAIALWRALRDVLWWARVPAEDRAELRRPAASVPVQRHMIVAEEGEGIASALRTFLRIITEPAEISARELSEACHSVSAWADATGYLSVRTLFAEAAAYTNPESPTWANLAAKACRQDGAYARAEIWYERGFRLAVRAGKKREQVWALLGYGTVFYALGRYDRARKWWTRAATRAARTNQPKEAAEAEHDLMTVASEVGTYQQGARHLRRALMHYPVRHWRLPFLVHDFAYLLIQNGQHEPALPLLRELLSVIPENNQLLLQSTLARAAAGTGDLASYEKAKQHVLERVDQRPEYRAAALRNLAEAALCFGDWDSALRIGRSTLAYAQERMERDVERSALRIVQHAALQQPTTPANPKVDPRSVAELSAELLARLARWRTPGRGRPGAKRRER